MMNNHYEEAQGWISYNQELYGDKSDRALQTSTCLGLKSPEHSTSTSTNTRPSMTNNSPEDVQAALDRVNEEPIVHVEDVFHLAYLWHCQQETIEGLYQLLMADIVEDEDPCL